ncbi:MAG TPA: DUF2470 domain-containing protein [Terrimesophilobacter sp.]|nr:DUF2470 domain-containing protein [Terrimesophilobacter sp.]HRQ00539.1 DUF2470 domain-containing protein [Terrimesophilobacter sp.]
MPTFSDDIVTAVLRHMNDDHTDDSLLIARAFGAPDAESARMVGLDTESGHWEYTVGADTHPLNVPWPAGPITERPEIRREVVALYDAACARLGIEPRPHE